MNSRNVITKLHTSLLMGYSSYYIYTNLISTQIHVELAC